MEAISEELTRQAMVSARLALLSAPIGSIVVFVILHSQQGWIPEAIWAVAAAFVGLSLALVFHLRLIGRLSVSRRAVRGLLCVNPIIASGFVLVFHPASTSREAMLESLICSIVAVSQLVTFSADRIATRFTAMYTVAVVVVGADALDFVRSPVRVVMVLPVALILLQMSERLFHQQHRNIELGLENARLIDDLQAANASLAKEVLLDPLTGLANRTGLYRELARESHRVGLLYLDVDRFKSVNDRYGHAEGDRVLQAVGESLRLATRPNDVVARIGGDEFVVILEGASEMTTQEVGVRICERIHASQELLGVTVSIGATWGTVSADTAEAVLARADSSLYLAKRNGGNRLELLPA